MPGKPNTAPLHVPSPLQQCLLLSRVLLIRAAADSPGDAVQAGLASAGQLHSCDRIVAIIVRRFAIPETRRPGSRSAIDPLNYGLLA